MATENRWAEYNAGTLTPPVVVQHDTTTGGLHLIWVYTVDGIFGPYFRPSYETTAFITEFIEIQAAIEEAANAEEVMA
jgi:hypothetical protein